MATLSATPYAFGGPFFYFTSPEEYKAKYKKNIDKDTGVAYEEYEIDYIDGDEHEFLVFQAMSSRSYGLPQSQIQAYFDKVDEIDADELPAIAYLIEDLNYEIDDAIQKAEEVHMIDETPKEAVYSFVDDMGGVAELGEQNTSMYFDYDSFGRDVRIEGGIDPSYDDDQYPVQDEPSEDDFDDEDDFEEAVEQYDEWKEAQQEYDRMSDEDIGYKVIDEIYGGVDQVDKSIVQRYYDFEAFARDLVLNGDWAEFRHGNENYTVMNASAL
jgi:antirestriction protein